jgi:hypothetical protein
VALERYAREVPSTAAQSPRPQTTTLLAAAVVIVADGAPVPEVFRTAGVVAICAPVQRVTTKDALRPDVAVAFVEVTVPAVPPAVTGAVQRPTHVWLAVLKIARCVKVPVLPERFGML